MNRTDFEVIIIGGSYAGLSAAMSLGRSLRQTLVIDSGKPCNAQTPHSHNFLTHDGETPKQIAASGKLQVEKYPTVHFYDGKAVTGTKTENGFEITTSANKRFTSRKLIFTTGLKDRMPELEGFADCWGISILHCPYCHGYEVRNEKTGIIGNGDAGFETAKMILNWTKDLTIFTNGKSTFTQQQAEKLTEHGIGMVEKEIAALSHDKGKIRRIVFKDNSEAAVSAIYARPPFAQHCDIPEQLGCKLSENGLLQVDMFQQTTVPGIYAAGDNSSFGRAVSVSVSSGAMAGAFVNKALIDEAF
ncbi:NAD(P)/FAD-dependent oxidoreductase [Dyadobacter sediminis]|uniref:NAD(P)/FAD-dependent oxidoreductase n=1 Tax=Dyadobacter sediminis TaxID=1493691 RepID=A0A5R9KC47_9BACT|nr:NAD(P)/FAD-dependent oxidoreductase [Dyadobacter sediminis]TLU92277.1 NAD(P)/FAD-dependent oxidoreductase [Dyadobacter sediminis]GGB95894.1 thioredoxin reductase [Dyadobacter sediminis]